MCAKTSGRSIEVTCADERTSMTFSSVIMAYLEIFSIPYSLVLLVIKSTNAPPASSLACCSKVVATLTMVVAIDSALFRA